MGITNPLVSTTAQRKTVWGTVFLRKAMRLVKIKDALPSDDLNLVGIEKDRHLAVFFISNRRGIEPKKEVHEQGRAVSVAKDGFAGPSFLRDKSCASRFTNPLVSTTAQRKTVWGTVFLRKAMRLVKIKDALSSDDLNLVGIEKDHHFGGFFYN